MVWEGGGGARGVGEGERPLGLGGIEPRPGGALWLDQAAELGGGWCGRTAGIRRSASPVGGSRRRVVPTGEGGAGRGDCAAAHLSHLGHEQGGWL